MAVLWASNMPKNALAAVALPRAQLGELTTLPRPLCPTSLIAAPRGSGEGGGGVLRSSCPSPHESLVPPADLRATGLGIYRRQQANMVEQLCSAVRAVLQHFSVITSYKNYANIPSIFSVLNYQLNVNL